MLQRIFAFLKMINLTVTFIVFVVLLVWTLKTWMLLAKKLLCFLYPLSACKVYIYKGMSESECAVHVGGYVVD